jgi:hypothetical protein
MIAPGSLWADNMGYIVEGHGGAEVAVAAMNGDWRTPAEQAVASCLMASAPELAMAVRMCVSVLANRRFRDPMEETALNIARFALSRTEPFFEPGPAPLGLKLSGLTIDIRGVQ